MDNNLLKDYQLYFGQCAKDSAEQNAEQAKNTADGLAYRIPSLLSVTDKDANETILCAFDMSESGGDFGRIQVMMRKSSDGGKTFGKMETVLSLPVAKAPQKRNDFNSAFAIDPILVQCKNGDVLLVCDVYPEGKGLMHKAWLDRGSGYVRINGKNYLALYQGKTKVGGTARDRSEPYTVRENGFVYTPDGRKTNYYLPKNHSAQYAFETVGDLYYAVGQPDYIDTCPPLIPEETENGDIYCGNVFLSYNKGTFDENKPKRIQKRTVGPDFDGDRFSKYPCVETESAPLSISVRNYLWVLRSSDCAKTWQQPLDISADMIFDDEVFLGTGPGVAICLKNQNEQAKNGRVLVPVYNTKKTAVLFSDDNGYTWHRSQTSRNIDETQLCELSNGAIYCFGRQRKLGRTPLSISLDGGETWKKLSKTKLSAVKCQKSVIALPKEIYCDKMDKSKDYILACNPSGTYQKNSERFGGVLTLGIAQDDQKITWIKQRRLYTDGVRGKCENFFAYSSLTVLQNGNLAVFYEALPAGLGIYKEFSLSWLLDGEEPFTFPICKARKNQKKQKK
ncbi:MAG: exo-alpha-sialidase [Acutalibacteraceae bacterium]